MENFLNLTFLNKGVGDYFKKNIVEEETEVDKRKSYNLTKERAYRISRNTEKAYKEKFKDIIDIKSEVDWLKCRGDIDEYFLYSNTVTNKFIVARRFDNHQIWYECFDNGEYSDYSFSSQSLVECCEWLGLNYYNFK